MNFITEIWTNLGPLAPFMVAGVVGILLVAVAVGIYVNQKPDPISRIHKTEADAKKKAKANEEDHQSLRQKEVSVKQLDKFANFLEPQDQKEFSATQLKMMQAGYRGRNMVRTFHFAQFALGLLGLFLGVIYTLATSDGAFELKSVLMSVIIPGGAGYYLPMYWIERRRQTRQEEIQNGFPDSLDLLLVCVEAGQSFDQAIIRVAEEIKAGFPALGEELAIVSHEIKAGKDKVTVLRDMSERAGVPDVTSFVTVLIQSTTFGTSISDALRVFSEEMRDKRVMRAEEKANKLPTKLTLGTMMFTVPPLLIILIGPSVFNIIELLGGGGLSGP